MQVTKKYTLITVSVDNYTLDQHLFKNAGDELKGVEVIVIDNILGGFKSLATAFNEGVRRSMSMPDYFIFAHPDIDLCDTNWLSAIDKYFDSAEMVGMVGVAGARRDPKDGKNLIFSNITHGDRQENESWLSIGSSEVVETIDECFFVVPTKIISCHKFDENMTGHHLIAAEYCMRLKSLGYKCVVLPIKLNHNSSGGRLPCNYFENAGYILKKYRLGSLYTTCRVMIGGFDNDFRIITQKICDNLLKWVEKCRRFIGR